METIIVDSDRKAAEELENECRQMRELRLAGNFEDPKKAMEYALYHRVEFALLEVDFDQMSGIELARRLREIDRDMIIIFVSANSQMTLEALRMKADYYVIKPYTKEDIKDALYRAKLLAKRQYKRMFIRTFGRFDVFIDGKLVKFPNAKSKELLALCVEHMGGEVRMEEAVDKLWPDRNYDDKVKALYRKAVIGVRSVLEEYGMPEAFYSGRGVCCLVTEEVTCDFYIYLRDQDNKKFIYMNKYMFEYSWAEETNAWLQKRSKLTGQSDPS
ncbi:response regulator [Clostridium sp. MCC353]|nr:response regulator [Clostridium sp. MCC353]